MILDLLTIIQEKNQYGYKWHVLFFNIVMVLTGHLLLEL